MYLSVDYILGWTIITYAKYIAQKFSLFDDYLVSWKEHVLIVQEQEETVKSEQDFNNWEVVNHRLEIDSSNFIPHLAVDQASQARSDDECD